jgi:hypothetical protein
MALTPEQEAEFQELEMRDLEEREAEEMAMKQPARRKQDEVSAFESFGRGVAGALSPISKYGEAAGIKARTAYEDYKRGKPSFGVPFDIAMETAEEQEAASREQQPGAYYGGMGAGILGGVGASLPAKIPGALGVLGIGAGTGGLQTAGSYPYQQGLEEPGEVLKATGAGALLGAGVSTIPLLFGARGPIIEGGKAAIKGTEGKGVIGGTVGAISEAIPAMRGAAQETQAFKEVVKQISPETVKQPTVGQYLREGAQVTPQEETQFLLNLLQQGKTPAKEFMVQKSTQLYPGQIGPQQLRSVLDIPLEQRVTARQFDPSAMGRQLQPQAEAAKQALGKTGTAFQALQEMAAKEYKRTQLPLVSNSIKAAKAQFNQPGTSALTRSTIKQIDAIINQGSALPRYGVTEAPLKSANAAEAYKRLQAAREYADRAIRKNPQDLSIQDILQPLRDNLDEVLKSSPSKVIADKLYASGKKVKEAGIKPLEMPIGERERVLSNKAIQSALGDTQKGEKMRLGIERARAFTQEFSEQLGPQEVAKIDKFFNALENARSVADQKRILDQLKFAEGPSGAAIRAGIEKLQQTIKPAPGGASMFRAAPEYLQSVDAFMSENARKYFGKSFDKLKGDQQYKLVNAFQWMKENPNAAQSEIMEKFNTILRGKGK